MPFKRKRDETESTVALDGSERGKESGVEEGEYVVEAIREHRRFRNGDVMFLVKWKGYPEDQCTWEPEENLTNCAKLLQRYKIQKMTRGRKKRRLTVTSDEEDESGKESASTVVVESEPESQPQQPSRQARAASNSLSSSSSRNRSPPSIQPPSDGAENRESGYDNGDEGRDEDANLPDLISTVGDGSSDDSDDEPALNASTDSSDSANSIEVTGWDRGWEPKKVLGVTRYPDKSLWVLMAWKDHEPELVPNHVANEKSPALMIEYYEKHLQWKTYTGASKK